MAGPVYIECDDSELEERDFVAVGGPWDGRDIPLRGRLWKAGDWSRVAVECHESGRKTRYRVSGDKLVLDGLRQ